MLYFAIDIYGFCLGWISSCWTDRARKPKTQIKVQKLLGRDMTDVSLWANIVKQNPQC